MVGIALSLESLDAYIVKETTETGFLVSYQLT